MRLGWFTCPAGLHQRVENFVASKPCSKCRATERLSADAKRLHELAPAIDHAAAVALLEAVAPTGKQRTELRRWLTSEADPLRSGRSDAPQAARQLLVEIDERGVSVALPRCARCVKPVKLTATVDGGRVCDGCYRALRAEVCTRCGRLRTVCTREVDGAPVCRGCRAADPDSWRPCGRCGEIGPTVATMAGVRVGSCCYVPPGLRCSVCGQAKGERPYRTRRPVCADCAAGERAVCVGCGLDAAVPDGGGDAYCERCTSGATASCTGCDTPTVSRDAEGAPRCGDCYQRKQRPCGRCGRVRVIVRLAVGGDPDLCGLCWKGPTTTCGRCGQRRPCRGERAGVMLCSNCQRAERGVQLPCGFCGLRRRVAAHWPDGPVCPSCYPRQRTVRGDCPRCGERRRLVRHTRGAPACADCLGVNEPGVCHDCGADDEPLWDAGRCPSCTLNARLDRLFGDDTQRAANGLEDLYHALRNAPSPRSVLDSLGRTKSGHLVGRIANGDVACSHDALDQLPAAKSVEIVRHLLVAVGVLPHRDPALARLERWINQFLAGIDDPDHAAVLRRYARWRILKPIRLKAENALVTDGTDYGARDRLRAAAKFLAHLAEQGRSLADCRQSDIDLWIAREPQHLTRPARSFVQWIIERRTMPRLDYPTAKSASSSIAIADDHRWAVARRLLHEPGIAVADRVAGCLVVIYAQPLTRISRLTTADVTIEGDRVRLAVGDSAIQIPHPLDDHLRELVNNPSVAGTVRLPITSWLFPSDRAQGRPIGTFAISKRLKRLGIIAEQFRQAALYQLAAQLPTVVVADTLGISIKSAEQWARIAGRDQADYLRLRGTGLA